MASKKFSLPQGLDLYSLLILCMAGLAFLAPSSGNFDHFLKILSPVLLTVLFFLHGAKLSREAIFSGLTHWKLHLIILSGTFLIFPLLGITLKPLAIQFISPELYTGFLFLCLLPSTVQSSIAFTSLAGGNVAAAVCSASASNMLGVMITPILVSLLIQSQNSLNFDLSSLAESVYKTSLQILLPFVIGHAMQPWLKNWLTKNRSITRLIDQSSILLIVYLAFSDAVHAGLWHKLAWADLLVLLILSAFLLSLIMGIMWFLTHKASMTREDRITVLFCGSKKSLATGVPIARILFPGAAAGPIILPLMIFHQIQLMVCSFLAQQWAKQNALESELLSGVHK